MGARRIWPWVFGAAVLARVAVLPTALDSPYLERPILDAAAYDAWGARIAGGDWLGEGVFFQDPLYPYLLGVTYAVVGHHPGAVIAWQMALGVLTALLVASIARRVFGPTAGLVAGLFAALYRMNVFYEAALLKVAVMVLLLVATLDLLLRARQRRPAWAERRAPTKGDVAASGTPPAGGASRRGLALFAAAGVTMGLGLQVRGHFFVVLPVLALWIATLPRTLGNPSSRADPVGSSLVRRMRPVAAFVAGVALALAPVTIRNAVVGGDVAVTTSQWGTSFYLGHHAENPWGVIESPSFVRTVPEHEEHDWLREAERRTGRTLRPSEVSRFWFGEALRFAIGSPLAEAKILFRRALLFWNHYEVSDNFGIEDVERFVPALSWGLRPFAFELVAPLAVGGLWFVRRRRSRRDVAHRAASPERNETGPGGDAAPPDPDGLRLLHWTLTAYFVAMLLFPMSSRFRMPVLPLLEMFAGAFVAHVLALLRTSRVRRGPLLARGGLVLVAAVIVSAPVYPFAAESRAHRHANLATAFLNEIGPDGGRPRLAEARAEVESALRLHPASPQAHRLLASILVAQADDAPPPEAARLRHEAERILTERALVPGRDLRNAATLRVRAWIRYVESRDAEAEADLRALLDLIPDDVESLVYLAAVTCNQDRCEEALPLLERAEHADPRSPHVHDTRCLILMRLGRMDEAWEAARAFERLGGRLSRPVHQRLEAWRAERGDS